MSLVPVAASAEPRRDARHLEARKRPPETLPLPFPAPEWLTANLHLHRKAGLEYRHALQLGGHEYTLGVQGPVVNKRRLNLGLAVQMRF